MANHNFSWVNQLFLWPFSSSQTVNVYQAGYPTFRLSFSPDLGIPMHLAADLDAILHAPEKITKMGTAL